MKVAATGIVLGLLAGLTLGSVKARDVDGRFANSPLHDWFEKLRSQGGAHCCSDADGMSIEDPDWETVSNPDTPKIHFRVRLQGQWVNVDDDAVVTEPNKIGKAMVWPYIVNGTPAVRCFMPGSMT